MIMYYVCVDGQYYNSFYSFGDAVQLRDSLQKKYPDHNVIIEVN